ncbi:Rhodanese-like protein [Biscogniauxia marginata]|nr:Rhodanese-like protein [Biscogniauxia marginata]
MAAPRRQLLALVSARAHTTTAAATGSRGAIRTTVHRAAFGTSSSSDSSRSGSYSRTPRAASTTTTTTKTTALLSRPRVTTRIPRGLGTTTGKIGIRWSSESATGSKIWTFEEISALTSSSSSSSAPGSQPKVTIIDVREPGELASTGRIPGSVNVPIASAPDSFHVAADEFEARHGFPRPRPDAEVVFYCKAGVRSRAAAGIARDAGWTRVGEFPGSWNEWVEKGGRIER